MKKISLKDVKNSLKRDEMRQISGGSASPLDYWTNADCLARCNRMEGWRCVYYGGRYICSHP